MSELGPVQLRQWGWSPDDVNDFLQSEETAILQRTSVFSITQTKQTIYKTQKGHAIVLLFK